MLEFGIDDSPSTTSESAGSNDPARMSRSSCRRSLLILAVSLLTTALPLYRGLSNARSSEPLDARWPFVAGRCWLAGTSPYDVAVFRARWELEMELPYRSPYVYPPHSAACACLLALSTWDRVAGLVAGLNVSALIAIVYLSYSMVWSASRTLVRRVAVAVGGLLAALASAVPMVVTLGQSSLMVVCGLMVAFLFQGRRRHWLAAWCIAGATVKPHLVVLPVLALLLIGPRRPIALGVGLACVIAALSYFLFSVPEDYFRSLEQWREHPANRYESLHGVVGILALSSRHGVPWTTTAGWVAAAVTLGGLAGMGSGGGSGRGWVNAVELQGVPGEEGASALMASLAATGAIIPLQAYDLVIFVPLFILSTGTSLKTWLLMLPGMLGLVHLPHHAPETFRLQMFAPSALEWITPTLAATYLTALLVTRHIRTETRQTAEITIPSAPRPYFKAPIDR